MRRLMVVGALMAGIGCRGAGELFRAHPDAVAVVGDRRLAPERLAELFGPARSVPIEAEVMNRLAHLWVSYVLLADRVVAGDSLLDSASVLAANWAAVHQILIRRLHERLVAGRPGLDSSTLDSIYGAGELRLVGHIFFRIDSTMSPAQVDAKRRTAERVRAALARGGSWERANQLNEDPNAKAQQGAVGVIARGETVGPFEAAAFALGPGEIAPVTQTRFGFHVIRRPPLSEVRQLYRQGVEQRMTQRSDSTYLAELPQRRHLKLKSGAPAAMRDIARDPLAARQSRRVLASFDGGEFTAGDFARWLDVVEPRMVQQLPSAGDQDLQGLLTALARNAMLLVEAREAGVRLSDDEYAALRGDLAAQLHGLRQALALEGLAPADTAGSRAQRAELAGRKVDAYFAQIAENPQRLIPVPQGLADRLRQQARWRVYPAGVQRAFDLARARRAVLDSAAGRLPPLEGGPRPR